MNIKHHRPRRIGIIRHVNGTFGQIPDEQSVITAANIGEPVILNQDSYAGKAYANIVGRICGEEIPFLVVPKDGLLKRLKKAFGF